VAHCTTEEDVVGWRRVVDYNNDGLLDLFVVNYCGWEVNKDPFCALKEDCAPTAIRSTICRCITRFIATTATERLPMLRTRLVWMHFLAKA